MRSLVSATSSVLLRLLLDSHLPIFGRKRLRAQSGSLFHLSCHSASTMWLIAGFRSSASISSERIREECEAALAASSALSLPAMPTWLGTHNNLTSPPSEWMLVSSSKICETSDEEINWLRSAITELAESATIRHKL
eukprot:GHVH01008461.1.p2 GENE.GHVH01008461.1~~GHVH01008461.1.p2  ORF type:complete len:137 (+),score=8.93 GHVH01008461.1:110-520(+)